jgi:hypothetical protein
VAGLVACDVRLSRCIATPGGIAADGAAVLGVGFGGLLIWNRIRSPYDPNADRHARAAQLAVDAAYRDIIDNEVIHERDDVVASWREMRTWIQAPVLLSGAVLGSTVRDYLLVGSTSLPNRRYIRCRSERMRFV